MHLDGDAAVAVDFLHGARERGHDRRDLGDRADHREARGEPRALEMARDLVAHDVGLFEDLCGERIAAARRRLVDHHRQRRLQRMRQIADMGARALDDFFVGVDQGIGFARQRRDLFGKFAGEPFGGAGADSGKAVGDALERRQAEAHLKHGGEQQHRGENAKR